MYRRMTALEREADLEQVLVLTSVTEPKLPLVDFICDVGDSFWSLHSIPGRSSGRSQTFPLGAIHLINLPGNQKSLLQVTKSEPQVCVDISLCFHGA